MSAATPHHERPPEGLHVASFMVGLALAVSGALMVTGGGFVLGYGVGVMVHAATTLHLQHHKHRRPRRVHRIED